MKKEKSPVSRKTTKSNNKSSKILSAPHNEFYQSVAEILRTARANAYRTINFTMVEAYWNVGRMIVEEEQKGKERAEYGTFIIRNLSIRLSEEFGKGFAEQSLRNMRQFFLCFEIRSALRSELRWTREKE